jgi:mono/diheme cytochrome c family protein
MRKLLKWIGIILGGLVALFIVAAIGLSFAGKARLSKTADVQPENIHVLANEAALRRGEHLVQTTCLSCHGPDLSGEAVIDDPAIGTIYAPNITGLAESRSDDELVLAIRHGVGPDGRQLIVMPADTFINLSAEDLGAVIAYLKSVPALENDLPEPSLGFLGRILLAAGMFGRIFPADYIDHNQPFPTMPVIGANVEYGGYLAGLCASCHGADLTGGEPMEPDSPSPPDLTRGGRLAAWSEDGFVNAMRTGVTPEGQVLDPDYMPWRSIGKLDDEELHGLWMFLQTTSSG